MDDLTEYDPDCIMLSDMPEGTDARRYWLINECLEEGIRLWIKKDGTVFIPCNDLFFWAVGDAEELLPEHWPRFMQDMGELCDGQSKWFGLGWVMRSRNLRCQKPYLRYMDEAAHKCFADCFGFKIEDLPHYGKTQGWPDDDKVIPTDSPHQFVTAAIDADRRPLSAPTPQDRRTSDD